MRGALLQEREAAEAAQDALERPSITHISAGGSDTLCHRKRKPGDISIALNGVVGFQAEGKTICKACRRIYFR